MPQPDKFGFRFWLLWILGFAGSFFASAAFWTWAVSTFLGSLQQPELLVTWALSVFGCWFLLLTPFMRKKERIWKRLNNDQEKATDAWLMGMGCFLGGLIAACFFWSWKLRANVFAGPGFDSVWGKCVFGTWLALTLPFLIFLYKKADAIFKVAHERQTRYGPRFQTSFLERAKRLLPDNIAEKIKAVPEALEEGHVVTLKLKDGREIPNVFIFRGNEVLGLYDAREMDFETRDVADVEIVTALPQYEESRWLRLDGRA